MAKTKCAGAFTSAATISDAVAEKSVDAALALVESRPAARTLVFAGTGHSRARPAANAAVAAIVQRIVGNSVRLDVIPHRLAFPIRHRIRLQDVKIAQHIEVIQLENLRALA